MSFLQGGVRPTGVPIGKVPEQLEDDKIVSDNFQNDVVGGFCVSLGAGGHLGVVLWRENPDAIDCIGIWAGALSRLLVVGELLGQTFSDKIDNVSGFGVRRCLGLFR